MGIEDPYSTGVSLRVFAVNEIFGFKKCSMQYMEFGIAGQ